ncbi:response regulator [bacterium]|nr:response regulator [bacterium]
MKTLKRILWIDDEIVQLKPHIYFLEEKGYQVTPASNGRDALAMLEKNNYDVVLLDEMMPGLDGLTTLEEMRKIDSYIPIIMITKSEEEGLMNEAIGREITDYLIKPVNPNQILLSLKKIFDQRTIVEGELTRKYTTEYRKYLMGLQSISEPEEWYDLANWLSEWNVIFDEHPGIGLIESHRDFIRECNVEFGKYIEGNYLKWLYSKERPTISNDLVDKYLLPIMRKGKKAFLIVVDCMRLDQWLSVEPFLNPYYDINRDLYYSLLPTATPFSRNAIFSGLFPSELARKYPDLWSNAFTDPQSRNRYEHQLLDKQLERNGFAVEGSTKYIKILDPQEGEFLLKHLQSYSAAPQTSVVINFLDILAHSRVNSDVIQEISPDDRAYRNIMKAWFNNSPFFEVLKMLSRRDDLEIVMTTDHGSVLGQRGTRAYGGKGTSSSLRYKYGSNLNAEPKDALIIREPKEFKLPDFSMSTTYIIAKEDYFFVYPSNFSKYEQEYKNSIIHGGISLEEMIIPVIRMTPKGAKS